MGTTATGLRRLGGAQPWYGGGYCGVCGATETIVPEAVSWWDCDDGWKVGVLCPSCTEYAETHPPDPDDYAYPRAVRQEALRDVLQEALGNDLDGMSSDYADFADLT